MKVEQCENAEFYRARPFEIRRGTIQWDALHA
jgi:hypothetical protein